MGRSHPMLSDPSPPSSNRSSKQRGHFYRLWCDPAEVQTRDLQVLRCNTAVTSEVLAQTVRVLLSGRSGTREPAADLCTSTSISTDLDLVPEQSSVWDVSLVIGLLLGLQTLVSLVAAVELPESGAAPGTEVDYAISVSAPCGFSASMVSRNLEEGVGNHRPVKHLTHPLFCFLKMPAR